MLYLLQVDTINPSPTGNVLTHINNYPLDVAIEQAGTNKKEEEPAKQEIDLKVGTVKREQEQKTEMAIKQEQKRKVEMAEQEQGYPVQKDEKKNDMKDEEVVVVAKKAETPADEPIDSETERVLAICLISQLKNSFA